jgi:fibronectin-binding autotransporter adhesin
MKPSPTLRALLLAIASFPAHSATAAIITWSGGSSNDNWSTAENWDAGLPAGNDVVFAATDATGTTGPLGTVNNLVDANTTVTSLKYTNLETTGYHTTQIPSGVTLTVNGGGTNIEVQSPTNGTDDVVYATILGDGTLSANNTAATLYVSQGATNTSTIRRATLDLSGLEEFSATLSRIIVGRQNVSSLPNRPQGTLKLARNNTLVLGGTPGILLGDIASNNGTGQAQVVELGTTNTIRSNTGMTIGGRKGNGFLRFNSTAVALGGGSAIFRDAAGTGRQANWLIGDNSTQGGGGLTATGVVDLSLYGEVDALVGNIILGHATAGTATAATTAFTQGTLTFDSGMIDTNSLTAGIQPATAAVPGNARGTVNVNGTGKLRVNGNVTLGRDIGEATFNAQGLVNIGGGEVTVSGNVICGTGTGNKITLTSGSLTLGGTLGDDAVAGDAPLETLQWNGGTINFAFGSAPNPAGSRAKVTNLNVPNPVNLTFSGANLSPGTIELIKYTTFDEATQFANLNLALPDRIEATLVNNTANSSVDLDITGVFSNKWSGDVSGGDWDINSTQNWKLTPGNTPSTYLQSAVPGEPVTFDDSATGTKTVNLTTTLSPAAITVDTEQAYTFNGSGAISGPGGLTKRGSGSLVIGNSGTNDFTGSITIEAGKIQLSGGNDRLPANASVTLSDVAAAELDLNNLNQSLVSLNGGGTTGGNVNLGTGTLAITGASSFAGVISGSGSVNKSGAGTLTLSGANSYSGGTHFSGNGVLALAHSTAAGSGPIQFATTQTGTNGTFTLNGGIDVANPIVFDAATGRNTINSVGTLSNTLSGNITIINNSGNFVVINNAAPAGSATSFTVGGATPNSTTITAAEYSFSLSFRASQNGELGVLNSRIDAPNATFDINNYGFWTINSTGNVWAVTSFVGSTTSAARIKLGADDALATGARISMGGTSPNSYLDLNGYNQTVAGLEGTNAASTIKNDSDTTDSVLTIAGLSADRNFVGGIVDGANGRKVSLVMNSSGFTQTLNGSNTYSGNTTVGSGTLTLAAPNLNNQSSTVTIAESGATLALNFNGSDTVGKLFIGTTQMDAGEYGAVGSAAPVIGIDQITGTGTLTVTSGPSSGGFASWQTANNATGGLDDDHDNDGVTNGIEYFIGGPGGNTTGFTPLPGVVNTAGTLSITWIKGSGYTGTYGTDFWVETSKTLTGTWPPETLPGGNITDDPGFVKFTFPSPLGTKKFARLKVSGP